MLIVGEVVVVRLSDRERKELLHESLRCALGAAWPALFGSPITRQLACEGKLAVDTDMTGLARSIVEGSFDLVEGIDRSLQALDGKEV